MFGLKFFKDGFFAGHRLSDRPIFPIDFYCLDGLIDGLRGLAEFSPEEYEAMPKFSKGVTHYNALPVNFLGYAWQLKLGIANGKIYKIAPYMLLRSKEEANPIAMHALDYCFEQLGKPSSQETGLFIWDTVDGNVILQTGEIAPQGFWVGLFLTSNSVRELPTEDIP